MFAKPIEPIAPRIKQERAENTQVELFDTEKTVTTEGKEVEVYKSLGYFNKTSLLAQKENYLKGLEDIEDKIAAIDALED